MEVSAYANTIQVMKWWRLSFDDRDSIDNHGINIMVFTHHPEYKNNAAWAGKIEDNCGIYIGDFTSPMTYSCAVAVDTLVHETTHDVIGGLPYKNITGAINEGYADIFGCLKDENWRHQEMSYKGSDYACYRNIANPADPDAYPNVI